MSNLQPKFVTVTLHLQAFMVSLILGGKKKETVMSNLQPKFVIVTLHLRRPKKESTTKVLSCYRQERAREKSTQVNPSWSWHIQGLYSGSTTRAPLFSTAASSGFNTSTLITASSAAVHQPQYYSKPIATNANSVSHYYCPS